MARIDWRENSMKFLTKRAPVNVKITLVGPEGDPDLKRLENYMERMNLEFDEIDTRTEGIPAGYAWSDQPIVFVNDDVFTRVKPQELAQAIGLALRHYEFEESEAGTGHSPSHGTLAAQ